MLEDALNSSKKKKVCAGWHQFKTKCHQLGVMMKVKLLFTCWKTTTLAMREGRKRQKILVGAPKSLKSGPATPAMPLVPLPLAYFADLPPFLKALWSGSPGEDFPSEELMPCDGAF